MSDQHRTQPGLFENLPEIKNRDLTAEMYCDGACSGNPGRSGIGVVINLINNKKEISGLDSCFTISEYIGMATNNVAEYSALVRGLEQAAQLGIKKLSVFLDSELLVRQMNGVYKVKNDKLIPFYNRAREIVRVFKSCTITHVRRELNKEADSLAREGVKKAGI